MQSARYRELVRRASQLRRHMLPSAFDPTGTYSDRVHDRAVGYRLLAHAEFESFVEDRVVEVANNKFVAWKNGAASGECLLALVAFEEESRLAPTSLLVPPQKRAPDIVGRVERAKNSLITYARSRNHGIREENILRLVMPIGIREGELNQQWLATLNSWAKTRGSFAHQSGGKLTTRPDPQDEYASVKALLQGFRELDALIDKLT